jgi:hypothetical protein
MHIPLLGVPTTQSRSKTLDSRLELMASLESGSSIGCGIHGD